jgi:hypothetical protein
MVAALASSFVVEKGGNHVQVLDQTSVLVAFDHTNQCDTCDYGF